MEKFDILQPPTFKKSGKVKRAIDAVNDEDWLGGFNLWIIQNKPVPAIVYQQRGLDTAWMPGRLDVSAAGHYRAGESTSQGLREVREELGKNYRFKSLVPVGRKMNVSPDVKGRMRHAVADVFMIIDNASLGSYKLQKEEVRGLFLCPIDKLIKTHTQKNYSFVAIGVLNDGKKTEIKVSKNSLPYNWDNYHFKMALLARRFLKGEQNLIY